MSASASSTCVPAPAPDTAAAASIYPSTFASLLEDAKGRHKVNSGIWTEEVNQKKRVFQAETGVGPDADRNRKRLRREYEQVKSTPPQIQLTHAGMDIKLSAAKSNG